MLSTYLDPDNTGDNDDLGGAPFEAPPLPVQSLVRDWEIPASKADGTGHSTMRFHMDYIGSPPRIEVSV